MIFDSIIIFLKMKLKISHIFLELLFFSLIVTDNYCNPIMLGFWTKYPLTHLKISSVLCKKGYLVQFIPMKIAMSLCQQRWLYICLVCSLYFRVEFLNWILDVLKPCFSAKWLFFSNLVLNRGLVHVIGPFLGFQ